MTSPFPLNAHLNKKRGKGRGGRQEVKNAKVNVSLFFIFLNISPTPGASYPDSNARTTNIGVKFTVDVYVILFVFVF